MPLSLWEELWPVTQVASNIKMDPDRYIAFSLKVVPAMLLRMFSVYLQCFVYGIGAVNKSLLLHVNKIKFQHCCKCLEFLKRH